MSRMLKALEQLQSRGAVPELIVPVPVPVPPVHAQPASQTPPPSPKPVEKPVAEEPREPVAKPAPRPSPAAVAVCEMVFPIDILPEAYAVAACSEFALSVSQLPEPVLPPLLPQAAEGPYDELAARLTARLSGGSAAAVALVCLDRTDPLVAMIVPLARAIAARGGPLLVVDCDVHEPALADRFATASQQGLIDLLPGPARWQEVIRPTEIAGVDLLPGRRLVAADGPVPDRLDLESLVYDWLQRYRLVLLAAGPLVRPETRSLLRCVHGAVLVLEASRTTEDAARRAARTIRTAGAHLVGSILVEKARTPPPR